MKKILLVVYDMLPYSKTWGGCQRMYFLAKELQNRGNKVKVVAFQRDSYNTYGKQLLDDVVYTEGQDKVGTLDSLSVKHYEVSKCPLWIKEVFYKFDYWFFNEIQKGNGIKSYIKFLKGKRVLKNILDSNSFDVAIVSCPPFNLFRCVPIIKKHSPTTRIIMDYRDPWNSWHDKNWFTRWREKRFQKKSDLIVCTNEYLCEDMSKKFNIPINSYRVFANGFIKEDVNLRAILTPEIQNGFMNIVYTGAVGFTKQTNDYRNTSRLMTAFEEVVRQGYPIRLVFVGVRDPDGDDILQLKEKLGDHLQVIGIVNNMTALAYVENADACLLLHTSDDNSGKYLISGKAYDYILKRKYILSIAKENSIHADLVKKYNIGENSVNDIQSIREMIIHTYHLWKCGKISNVYASVNLDDFSRDSQIKRYIDLIDSI